MILCQSIVRKPQVSLFLLVLVLCTSALLGALIKLYIVESIVDPDVKSADIDIISHHLLVVIALLVSIIVAITLYLIFLNVGKPYEPLPAENYKDPDEDVFTDSI
ncbi:unnamed protein product [Schistocephalus solidus]|uniref:Transmembrane protein n=1 Tax=Schistocephalus solidus TaxID=70667 RepID=A0A183SIG8_SCHSO|nr:unnamed protein product [Schistocephalus solidus]